MNHHSERGLNYCDSYIPGDIEHHYTETRNPKSCYSVINAQGQTVKGALAFVTDYSGLLVPTGILSGNKIPHVDSESTSFNPIFGMDAVARVVEYKDEQGKVVHTDFKSFPQIDPEISKNMIESSGNKACDIQQKMLKESLFKVTTHDSGIQLIDSQRGTCFFELVDNEIPLMPEPDLNDIHGLILSKEWRRTKDGSQEYRWFIDFKENAVFEITSGGFPFTQQHSEYTEMHKISIIRGVQFGRSLQSPEETLNQLRQMAQSGILSQGVRSLVNPYIRLDL